MARAWAAPPGVPRLLPRGHVTAPGDGYGPPVSWWGRAARGIGRRDVALVAGLAVTLVVDSLLCPEGNLTVGALPAVGLVTLPLLWRSRAPRVVCGLVVLGVVACLMTLKPVDVIALLIMVAPTAARRSATS